LSTGQPIDGRVCNQIMLARLVAAQPRSTLLPQADRGSAEGDLRVSGARHPSLYSMLLEQAGSLRSVFLRAPEEVRRRKATKCPWGAERGVHPLNHARKYYPKIFTYLRFTDRTPSVGK
jgi:hypothetical protein